MVTAILTHEVKNFSDWKKGFDEDGGNRTAMGLTVIGVYQGVDNPNMVTVIAEMASAEAIKGIMANPDMKVVMEKAGVIGQPQMLILNKN